MNKVFFKIVRIALSLLIIVNSFLTYNTINADDPIPDLEIREFSISLVSGAEIENGKYVWNAESPSSGHGFIFQIDFALSGQYSINEYDVEIRIPLHILKDREGNYADEIEMSIPTKEDVDAGVPISYDINYCYFVDGNEIVIQNFNKYHTGENAFIQLKYITSKSTLEYRDMWQRPSWATRPDNYEDASDPFKATIKAKITNALGEEVNVSENSNEIPVYINTTAQIVSTTKEKPTMYEEWNSDWGDPIEDADKYNYLVWPVYTSFLPNLTQPFQFALNEYATASKLLGSIVGYKLEGEKFFSNLTRKDYNTTNRSRMDYVLTKHDKSLWNTEVENTLYIENSVQGEVVPYDRSDYNSTSYSTASYQWRYENPSFVYPPGDFASFKRADRSYNSKNGFDYLGMVAKNYSRYDLHKFINGDLKYLDNLDYAVWAEGFPYSWTLDENDDDTNPNNYRKNKVLFETIDETFILYEEASNFPNPNVGFDNDTYGIPVITEDTFVLDYNDFQIDSIAFNVEIHDAYFNENSLSFVEEKTGTFLDDDVLILYGRFNDDPTYIEIASKNMLTGEYTYNQNYVSSIIGYKLIFKEGVNCVGYKACFESNHYFTKVMCVPNIRLKNSTRVLDYIKDMESIAILNSETSNFYDYQHEKILNRSESATNYISKSLDKTRSYIQKSVNSKSNSVNFRQFKIGWNIDMYEKRVLNNERDEIIEQNGGTFYDLLPGGAILDRNSIVITDDEVPIDLSLCNITTIDNYNNTGRTLLIVDIDVVGSKFSLSFDTIHSWDAILDWGKYIYNPVIYKTGNDELSEINPGYRGYNNELNLFKDIIDQYGEKRFIYAETSIDISFISSAAANLHKKVKDSFDKDYSYDTYTRISGDYSYRLRFQNTTSTKSKDIIFFDSIENYVAEQPDGSFLSSEWHGTLQSVDVSQLKQMGIEPVVYLSSIENLNIEENHDISDSSVWKEMSVFGDITKAKAIAIDCRKDSNGNNFVLPSSASIEAVLYMKAPDSLDNEGTTMPRTFNNVYLEDTIIDSKGGETHFFIHQDYTVIRYKVVKDFSIHKVNADDHNESINRVSYLLKGTSAYGTNVNIMKTTNIKGRITFNDIELGDYDLIEVDCPSDWVLDKTVHKVSVKNDGNVWIDGNIVNEQGVYTFTNVERITGKLRILKVEEGTTVKQKKIISKILEIEPKSNKTVRIDNKEFYVLVRDDINNRALLAQSEPYYYKFFTNSYTNYINSYVMFWNTGTNPIVERGTVRIYSENYLSDKPELSKLALESEFPVYGSHWKKYARSISQTLVEENIKTAVTKAIPLSYSDFEHDDIDDIGDFTYGDTYIIGKDDGFLWDLFKLTALRTTEYNWPFYTSDNGATWTSKYLLAYFDDDSESILYVDEDKASYTDYNWLEPYYPTRYPEGIFFYEQDPINQAMYNFYAKTVPVVWVNLANLDADKPISDTVFKLEGTSDYGTNYSLYATSNNEGHLIFDDIEKGSYTLREIEQNENYVLNETVWEVYVNEDGSVVVKEPGLAFRDRLYQVGQINGEWIIQNEPRYWEFEIDKVLKGDHDTHIEGVEFNLYGISDLNNEININVTTDENGIAKFTNIEKGNYILREIAVADDGNEYYLDNDVYDVSIDFTGKVKIPKLESKDRNSFYFENDVIKEGELIVRKQWNDYYYYNRSTPRIHISTIPLDTLSSIYDFDDNGMKDLGNGEYEYISFDDRWITKGYNTQYYKFKVLDDTRKYYVYEEPMNGYTFQTDTGYVVLNDENDLNKTVTVENTSNNGSKIYIAKTVEAGNLYAPTDIEDSIVVHSDNLDDDGLLYSNFNSRNSVLKYAHIEGAEALDIVLTAGFGGTLYVFSGDPNDPNSPAYSRNTYDASFVITKPYGNHEENTYHFRIEGEYVTFYFSSSYNTDYSDLYGFFARIKAAGLPSGTAEIPDSEQDKEYLIRIALGYYSIETFYTDDVFFKNGVGYFKLKDGEIKVFNNLTMSDYSIVEVGEFENYETFYRGNTYDRNHTITNKYIDETKTELVLRKETKGNYIDDSKYTFEIGFSNLKTNTEYFMSNGDSFVSTKAGEALVNVELKSDEEVVFTDIPFGTKYIVKEFGGDYITSYQIIDENNVSINKETDQNYIANKDLSTQEETISNKEKNIVIFTNEINKYQDLYVSKQVIGNNYDYEFEFDITIENLLPNTYYETSLGKFISDESGVIDRTIVIRHGEVFEAYDLPINATYSIEEKDYVRDGFVSSVTTNTENSTISNRKVSGTIIYGENPEISYVNVEHAVVSGGKSWLDGGLSHNNPDEIELILYRYSDNFDEEIVDAEPIWEDNTFYYLDLQLNDEFDSPYTYRVVEKEIEGYTSVVDNFNLINTRDKASIILRKEVTGNGADENKEFTFTIKLTNKENKPVSGNFSGVAFDENGIGVVKLKHNQEIEIEIYKDIKYEISEDPEDYICEIDKADGIVGQGNNTHLFVNGKYNTEEPSKKVNDDTRIVFKDFEDDIVYTISQVVPEYCESFIIEDNIPSELIIVSYSINDDNLTITRDGQLIKVECNDKEILSKLKNKEIVLTIVTKVDESKLVYDTSIENTATTTINNQVFTTNSTYVDVPPPDDNPPDEKIYVPPKTGLE